MAIRTRRLLLLITVTCIALYIPIRSRRPPLVDFRDIRPQAPVFPIGQPHTAFPIENYIPIPTIRKNVPKVQYDFQPEAQSVQETRLGRRDAVKEAILQSWTGYREKAWLHDELAPIMGIPRTTLGGWGLTLVDALDTLWIAGMVDEFEDGVRAIADIDFSKYTQPPINLFEVTIRYLGGLLGAYDICKGRYPVLLEKAVQLGDMLYGAFDTPNHMPITLWSSFGPGIEPASGRTLVAELGTLSLEFTRLTQLSGDPRYFDAVQRITDCLEGQQNQTKLPGLFPHIVNARDCYFGDGVSFSIGGSADSVYEYFPKQWQLLRGAADQHKRLYEVAKKPMKELILFKPPIPGNGDIVLAGTTKAFAAGRTEFVPSVQHLSCFAGGMFALAAKLFDAPEDMQTAKQLTHGCIWAYNQTITGIMPEMFTAMTCPLDDPACVWDEASWETSLFHYNSHDSVPEDKLLAPAELLKLKSRRLRLPPGMPAMANRAYELRPEALESIFVLFRITGDEALRDRAWEIFQAINNHTRTKYGYSCIEDVTKLDTRKTDKMESFWIAETLKYLYLIFDDPDVVSLDDFVFNTEAHPFRLPK